MNRPNGNEPSINDAAFGTTPSTAPSLDPSGYGRTLPFQLPNDASEIARLASPLAMMSALNGSTIWCEFFWASGMHAEESPPRNASHAVRVPAPGIAV